MWSKRNLAAEYRGGYRGGDPPQPTRSPQSPFIEHRRARMVDSSQVPAANKMFAPPWAEVKPEQSRWSSEYHERYAFGAQWYQHMRRGAAPKTEDGDPGGLEDIPIDSLLLPWDNPAHKRPMRQERGVSNVLEFSEDDDDTDEVHMSDEVSRMRQAQVVAQMQKGGAASGAIAFGRPSSLSRSIMQERGREGGGNYSGLVEPEQRHRPSGRALAWKDQEASAAVKAQGNVQVGWRRGRSATGGSMLADCGNLASEYIKNATAPLISGDLDVHGSASNKATLAPETYSRQRGAGKPAPNAGAAPVGQPFIERGPARHVNYGRGTGLVRPKPSPQSVRPRSASAARGASARKTKGDDGTWNPIYSENWYEKKDKSFGHDLRAFQQASKQAARSSTDSAGSRPLLPTTKYAGINLAVQSGKNVAAQRAPAQKGMAKVPTREQQQVHQPGASKRKALQHGRPQVAGSGKAPATVAAVEPVEEPVSYGRVTAVPGLSLYQPTVAVAPARRPPAPREARETSTRVGDNMWRTSIEKPAYVEFAGAGGGRASDEVLAMTSPNLVGGSSQMYQVRVHGGADDGEPRRRPASAQPIPSRDLSVSPAHNRCSTAQGPTEALRPAGLGSWDMPTCKAGGLRRSELSAAMLRSSVGDILASPTKNVF